MNTYRSRLNLLLVCCLDHDKVFTDKSCHLKPKEIKFKRLQNDSLIIMIKFMKFFQRVLYKMNGYQKGEFVKGPTIY